MQVLSRNPSTGLINNQILFYLWKCWSTIKLSENTVDPKLDKSLYFSKLIRSVYGSYQYIFDILYSCVPRMLLPAEILIPVTKSRFYELLSSIGIEMSPTEIPNFEKMLEDIEIMSKNMVSIKMLLDISKLCHDQRSSLKVCGGDKNKRQIIPIIETRLLDEFMQAWPIISDKLQEEAKCSDGYITEEQFSSVARMCGLLLAKFDLHSIFLYLHWKLHSTDISNLATSGSAISFDSLLGVMHAAKVPIKEVFIL
jgi:hypothetical protein